MNTSEQHRLLKRVGRVHLDQRLGLESHYETKVFGQGIQFFHLENWYSIHSWIRNCMRLAGLHGRAQRNALNIKVREHTITLRHLPTAFNDFRILHISDLHVDINSRMHDAIIQAVAGLDYDICVLTGDYRARTGGPYDETIHRMEKIRAYLKAPVYGVLGNHDTIRLVIPFEDMGISMLINEHVRIERNNTVIYLAGIDDAHYFRVDNIERAAEGIQHDTVSILLSHTPETYKQAAFAHFDVFLCGHTHGGQICLPGGIPVTWDARCPMQMARGSWQFENMTGYTSVGAGSSIVDLRLNCDPEITIHRLTCF